jgi:hypothetical protein
MNSSETPAASEDEGHHCTSTKSWTERRPLQGSKALQVRNVRTSSLQQNHFMFQLPSRTYTVHRTRQSSGGFSKELDLPFAGCGSQKHFLWTIDGPVSS